MNKNKIPKPLEFEVNVEKKRAAFPYQERHCWLYISSKYNEILFVPMGKIDPWKSRELDSVVVEQWPLNIGELQDLIQETLDKWTDPVANIDPSKANWYSFNSSRAKTQKSFHVDYVHVSLTTDMEREYGQGEVERILVKV